MDLKSEVEALLARERELMRAPHCRFPQPILITQDVYDELNYDWFGTMTHQQAMMLKWVLAWRRSSRPGVAKKHRRRARRFARKWGPRADAVLATQIPLHELAWPDRPRHIIRDFIFAAVKRERGRMMD